MCDHWECQKNYCKFEPMFPPKQSIFVQDKNYWKGSDFACGGSRYPDDFGGWSFENLVERSPVLDKWDKRFIKLARTVSEWSKDATKVGAVLTRPDHSLVSVGFNGLIPGMDDALLADREF